jgi:hypothetical protein
MAGWRGGELAERFRHAQDFLRRHESLWRPQAFRHPVLSWEQQFPLLAQRLRALDLEQAEAGAENETALVELLGDDLPELQSVYAALALPEIAGAALPPLREAVDVPGRKWRQLQAFAARVPASSAPLLEWCAGKAHLGRLLAHLQHREVWALEWNERLVADGARLARRAQLPVEFICVDVLGDAATALLRDECDVVALHACGELHLQLLRGCVRSRPRGLVLAPCCYQLIPGDTYRPLSRLAADADLHLGIADLHTAVRDSVTSPRRVQLQRRTLQAWRLGFDALQRELRGADSYLPTPSLPLSALKMGFVEFCRAQAVRNAIALPAGWDDKHYEATGWQRLREVAGLDLARIACRRPLEIWLALDRALYLQEHGYDVELGAFCARELTPRNILIRAQRSPDR